MTARVKTKIEKLRAELERHTRLYYVEARPEISDLEFDKLLKELEQLEEKYPEYDSPDSPTKKVGGEPISGFETVEHRVPMLSIDNTYSADEVRAWIARVHKSLGRADDEDGDAEDEAGAEDVVLGTEHEAEGDG